MMMRARQPIACLTIAAMASIPAPARSAVELYRRIVPLEAKTGVVSIRESVARQLEVPDRCDDGRMYCSVTRRYAHLYRVDFAIETKKQADGESFKEFEDRGSVYLALAAAREEEEAYDALLRKALSQLGAAAFSWPFAGLRPGRSPFGDDLALHAAEPSWTCFAYESKRTVGRYEYDQLEKENGEAVRGTGIAAYDDEKVTGPLCEELEKATLASHPAEMRTMSTPSVIREQTLTVEVADMLRGEASPGELADLPEGCELSRQKAPGATGMQTIGDRDDVITAASTKDQIETSARMTIAELPPSLAGENAWHARWELQTVERRLGPLPESRVVESWSLTASLMPTLPPRDLDAPDDQRLERSYDIRLDEGALLASIAQWIDSSAEVTPEVLAQGLTHKLKGLGPTGWLLVLCMPDGAAWWALPQVGVRAELKNGDLFCGAVESYLP